MSEPPQAPRKRRLLNGAALFLVLVVYFNLRSPGPSTAVDWIVMGTGAVVFVFALWREIRWRRGQKT